MKILLIITKMSELFTNNIKCNYCKRVNPEYKSIDNKSNIYLCYEYLYSEFKDNYSFDNFFADYIDGMYTEI